jgi:hypothetical protein
MKMKVFTIESGEVTEGARVDSFTLKGANVTIPAIIIGEEGRGRELGILPVQLLPASYKEWQEKGYTHIHSARVGTTKAGKPKLFQTEDVDTLEKCICIFRTKIGVRGSNSHTGDLKDEYYVPGWRPDIEVLGEKGLKEKYTKEEAISLTKELSSLEGREYEWDVIFEIKFEFFPFPGEVLCKGIIAQGDAGRAGSGEQLVAVIPADTVFRTGYSGRLYGRPAAHYYIYRDGQVISATWKEREVSEVF